MGGAPSIGPPSLGVGAEVSPSVRTRGRYLEKYDIDNPQLPPAKPLLWWSVN